MHYQAQNILTALGVPHRREAALGRGGEFRHADFEGAVPAAVLLANRESPQPDLAAGGGGNV